MYVSMVTPEEAKTMTRDEVIQTLGVLSENEDVIQPPKCLKCKCDCYLVELDRSYLYCSGCGKIKEASKYKDTFFQRSKHVAEFTT